ncbi:hypothetical protein JFV29_13345 [Peribacillus sp. TH16]|uniref:hypothetical protein n=1 Tax=Peribacillus TaxID=2675229 RepID=UPI00191160BE|nr:hypothetical protein [Peribacillus sp. TH16]MBK5482859.1 hypothetical protein [Peribacillus sp. TH16]
MRRIIFPLFIILIVSALAITVLLRIGPFEQPIWMQVVFLFSTSTFTYIAFKNKSKFSFVIVSICAIVMLFSLLLRFVS